MLEDAIDYSRAYVEEEMTMYAVKRLDLLGRELNETLGTTGKIGRFKPTGGGLYSKGYVRANLVEWVNHQLNESLRTRTWPPEEKKILEQLVARMQAESPSSVSQGFSPWLWAFLAVLIVGFLWFLISRKPRHGP